MMVDLRKVPTTREASALSVSRRPTSEAWACRSGTARQNRIVPAAKTPNSSP
ncbi:hypothetical protein AEGHOMDF_0060 [Methylobacterium soli]|nr:hypothetical protein AEGHOMDF_0060 [Methylobacterium soli]